MSKTKYRVQVLQVGEYAQAFIDEGILVFFAKNAPEELLEHAIVHDGLKPQTQDVKPGDQVFFNGKAFPVLAVGTVANENLRNLGHLVVKFNGEKTAELPGDVNLPQVAVPAIAAGMIVEIKGE